ncbi:hypothetical protein BDR26DRAFT_1006982 [Obelidium mucronatum]|nr:hypothetical protein BDR26DRAFT_1006982 [Obelidium mucronatum]
MPFLVGRYFPKSLRLIGTHLDAFSQNQFEIQVRGAKWDMDMIIKRRLERMTRDNRVPLVDRRRKNDEDTFYIKAVGKTDVCLSTGLEYSRSIEFRKNVEVLTGLYSADDIFEAIRSLQPITPRHTGKSQNTDDGLKTSSGGLFSTFWSTCHIAYQALTVEEFRHEFKELCPNFLHVGVDDLDDDTFATKTSQAANRILSSKSISEAHCFSKQGIPGHCRADMWDLMIQSDFTIDSRQNALEHCCFLKAQVARYELLTDHMIISDSEDCKADDNYFVFEDLVQDILLLWSRDEWHLKNSPNAHPTFFDAWIETEIKNKMKGKWSLPVKSYPPNGIFPFSGISSYAMLVTFIRAELETAYMMFRELYAKYFFKLHTISTYSDGIMTLAVTFESFLKQLDPLLFLHLTHEIGCPPITYAFRWLMFGFVGVLDVEQVLLLWDRILGFDRMEILSAVGASIFLFRKERLMEAKTEKDVERALMDLAND